MPTIKANNISMYYETTGHRGPWVTLIHGSADNHRAWELHAPALAIRFRVLTYDVRGHGQTETPASVPVTQDVNVEDLRGLLDALRIRRTAVVGYSMGGGIARNFAAAYPDRVWAAVLSNGGARLDQPVDTSRTAEMAKMREERIASIRAKGMAAVFDGWIEQVYTPEFIRARPEIVQWHRQVCVSNDPEKYLRTMGGGGVPSQVDLNKITAPMLLIVGTGDGYNPVEGAQEFAQALKGTKPETILFPTRHGSPFERHEEYIRTLQKFLGTHRPQRQIVQPLRKAKRRQPQGRRLVRTGARR
ncbi:MAG: alpha/beta fold hydrolase [Dehalococcoidia bacterium]|nr:alpha/beta fold hydrolase [Dehalococcoidia bacterium]